MRLLLFENAALLLCWVSITAPASALRTGHGRETSSEVTHAFREKIRLRFLQVDADGDGEVSLAEMRRGFGHEPAHVGEGLLREMLAECAGGDSRAESCTREQMERSLKDWVDSHVARTSVAFMETGSQGGSGEVEEEEKPADAGFKAAEELVDFKEVQEQYGSSDGGKRSTPCGPSAETPAKGLEGVRCRVHGAECVRKGSLAAWSLNDICRTSACICEPTAETKRLAKVGLMGAGAVTTAKNFSDPGDHMMMPDCGAGWTGIKVVDRMDQLNKVMSPAERVTAKAALTTLKKWGEEDFSDTEVGLFKTSSHELVKGQPSGKLCMMSWQASRSDGDWKLNMLNAEIPFKYSPKGVSLTAPKGIELSYESIRDKLKRLFEQECCTPAFQADKVIISGHSHGGAMAEVHAVDAVTNWKCHGRDLGAKNLAVVLVAPHVDMWASDALNRVFSCNDPAACLAGSVVTLTTVGDFVGDRKFSAHMRRSPKHPSTVYKMPCPPIPRGANRQLSPAYVTFWCHGLYNYVPLVEQMLVGEAGWGSTCGGVCGNPNRMVQCNQWVLIKEKGCSYADKGKLKTPTTCPRSRWLPQEERCDCRYDLCTDLSTLGCSP